ncbi:L-dopachrome tautomerase-related protein [Halomonas sp. YLGW01]|uniref:L-dopachrome tautomerase-related protein n=1 Tax=Halomonas sp. YLGW01 TaxID=2773308 RepID=UPI0017803FC3|nr:L-dopachrome tautomerase-related protein [Halomonas sp. YLGW01]
MNVPRRKTTALLAAMAASVFSLPGMAQELKTYASLSDTRPGNITVLENNRVIITQQPLDNPTLRVVEVAPDGTKRPFPTQDWADGPDIGEVGIAATIGIDTDSNGVVWILDMGDQNNPAQLVGWDTRANELHKVITIPADATLPISFLQDFAIDEKRGKIYIADMTFTAPATDMRPAFVVVDIETGEARRVLQAAPPLMPVYHDVVIVGQPMAAQGTDGGEPTPWHLAMNAISIDPAFEHVYFGTVNGSTIFRLPAAALADPTLEDEQRIEHIEPYADKRPNDGFIYSAGLDGVVSGDIEQHAVTLSTPDAMTTLAQDEEHLRWPDGFAYGPDGTLYITSNQLNTHPALNAGEDGSDRQYYIMTLSP